MANRNGYITIYMPEHHRADSTGCVYEHMVKAEEKLGRELKDGECVHHINEKRNDNRIENLMVFKTVADHTAFHEGSDIYLDGDVYIAKICVNNVCPKCGGFKDNSASLCLQCSYINRRKVKRPSKDELFDLILNNSFVSVGKMYGVSDNTIRKWCKTYELPYKRENIDKLIL